MSFGLGFSHQEVNKRCRTVVRMRDGDSGGHVIDVDTDKPHNRGSFKNKFRKLGLSVMKKMKGKSMDEETEASKVMTDPAMTDPSMTDPYGTTIIGGEKGHFVDHAMAMFKKYPHSKILC